MKIYFTTSIHTTPDARMRGETIVSALRAKKHEVYETVFSRTLPALGQMSEHQMVEWHKEWSSYVASCDVAVVEASFPSTVHIGFEIGLLLSHNKSVIVLFEEGKDPVFVNSLYSSRLVKSSYTTQTLSETLDWCLDEVRHISRRRFTFFVSPEIDTFLDEVTRQDGASRAEYIRMLIEADMKRRD